MVSNWLYLRKKGPRVEGKVGRTIGTRTAKVEKDAAFALGTGGLDAENVQLQLLGRVFGSVVERHLEGTAFDGDFGYLARELAGLPLNGFGVIGALVKVPGWRGRCQQGHLEEE